jgi:DNA-binding NarL/FixJ family response regulator
MAVPRRNQRQLRAVVLDDNPELLDAVVDLLTDFGIIEIVGACTDLGQAMDAIRIERAEVILLDALLATGGHVAAARLREAFPKAVVIGMSTTGNTVLAAQLARAGARAFVVKEQLAADLPRLIDDLRAELEVQADLPRSV